MSADDRILNESQLLSGEVENVYIILWQVYSGWQMSYIVTVD